MKHRGEKHGWRRYRKVTGPKFYWQPFLMVVGLLCLVGFLYTALSYASPTNALGQMFATGSLSSSPTSGPVGSVVTVNGSGWAMPNGTQVSFGYTNDADCMLVPDSQLGTLQNGAFHGWFRWPANTGKGAFTVCAVIGATVIARANSFTVLATAMPQVNLTPATPTAGKSATISGQNYLPAGSQVQLRWQAVNGSGGVALGTVIADKNGAFSKTFTVPANTQSGSYTLIASVGANQPPTLTASVSFQVNGVTPAPVSTPAPKATASPTTKPKPTVVSTAVSTQTTGNGGTTGTTQPGNGQPQNTHGTVSGGMNKFVLGSIGLLVVLAALGVVGTLFYRRRAPNGRGKSGRSSSVPSRGFSWHPVPGSKGFHGNQPLPVNVSHPGAFGMPDQPGFPGVPSMPGIAGLVDIQPMQPTSIAGIPDTATLATPISLSSLRPRTSGLLPFLQNTRTPNGAASHVDLQAAYMSPAPDTAPIQIDAELQAIMREAQVGLFATPRPYKDDR